MQWFVNEVRERFARIEERLTVLEKLSQRDELKREESRALMFETTGAKANPPAEAFSARIRQLENEVRMVKARMSRRIYDGERAAP